MIEFLVTPAPQRNLTPTANRRAAQVYTAKAATGVASAIAMTPRGARFVSTQVMANGRSSGGLKRTVGIN